MSLLDLLVRIQGRDSALSIVQSAVVLEAESFRKVGQFVPGSGATSFGATFSGASKSTSGGSSKDGVISM